MRAGDVTKWVMVALPALLLPAVPLYGQDSAARSAPLVRGVVREAGADVPVAGARVESAMTHRHVETAANGTFMLRVPVHDTLVVRALGYRAIQFDYFR